MKLKNLNIPEKIRYKKFWVMFGSFIALTGQVFGLYQVPEGWDTWVNLLLSVLVAAGIVINQDTSGLSD